MRVGFIEISDGRTLHIDGHRIHHVWPGLALVCTGVGLIINDLDDRRVWVSDLLRKTVDA